MDRHGKQPPRPDGQVPPALPVQVHSGAVDIACWRVHDLHPVPALIDPGHRRLRQLLGLVLVAGEQVQGSDQARVLGLEERLEAQGLRHVPQGRPSHPCTSAACGLQPDNPSTPLIVPGGLIEDRPQRTSGWVGSSAHPSQ
jgi:hypothetical protein